MTQTNHAGHTLTGMISMGLAYLGSFPIGAVLQALAAIGAFCGGVAALGGLIRTIRFDIKAARAARQR